MDDLRAALKALESPRQRNKKSLIAILLPAIDQAQADGFRIKAIHGLIDETIGMSKSTLTVGMSNIRADIKSGKRKPSASLAGQQHPSPTNETPPSPPNTFNQNSTDEDGPFEKSMKQKQADAKDKLSQHQQPRRTR